MAYLTGRAVDFVKFEQLAEAGKRVKFGVDGGA